MQKSKILLFVTILGSIFIGCNKNNVYDTTIPASQASFANVYSGSYYVTNSTSSVYKIPVGITTISSVDRSVIVSASSSTGAAAGVQYTLPSTTVIIPAGKVLDSLSVKGIFAGFPGTRRDTLTIKITGGDVAISDYNSTFNLIMQKSCDVIAASLSGSYPKSTDFYNGAASTKPNYSATISSWVATSATSATILIQNLGATPDNGWGYVTANGGFRASDPVITPGLTATLDWSNPANFTVKIPLQNYFNDGSGVSTITGTGTFSSCDNNFNIVCTVKYTNGSSYVHTSVFNR
ncbi:MAG: hypothetical protein H7101_02100 [Deinococcales bacterium]|nr:hypothetical protein [Chitinophagaceae bacterium]